MARSRSSANRQGCVKTRMSQKPVEKKSHLHVLAPRRSKWIPRWISNDIGPIGLEMAVFCGSPTSAEIMKPIGISSRSVKKPLFRHQSHGSGRVHDQPHVKTEAAAGGGRKASLYMGLVMRTQSPMRLRASGRPAALAHQGVRNLVRNPLETSKNRFYLIR